MKNFYKFAALCAVLVALFVPALASAQVVEEGCKPSYRFSPLTGQPCTGFQSGCLEGFLFSATTGQPCTQLQDNNEENIMDDENVNVEEEVIQEEIKETPKKYKNLFDEVNEKGGLSA